MHRLLMLFAFLLTAFTAPIATQAMAQWAMNPVATKQSADIQQGAGKTNNLHVRFEGPTVTLFINGKEQSKQKLQAPGGPSYVGIYAQAAEKSANHWDFSKLKVTEVK